MGYTNVALLEKIKEMYPDIDRHGITVSLDFNRELKTYDIRMKKDARELLTHLEKKDADECMDGIKCVYLGVKVSEFIRNFEEKK